MAHNPAFGAGLNAYPQALAPYHNSTQYEIFQYPHNIVLNIWTELGLLGLIAFGLLAWLTWRSVTPTTKNSQQKTLLLAAFAALLTMTIHGLVDVPYFKNDLSVMVWILFAVLATTSHANKTTDVRTPQQNFSQHLPTLLPRSTHGQTGIRQTSGFNHIEIYPNTGTVESRVENLTANSVAFEKVVRPQSYNL